MIERFLVLFDKIKIALNKTTHQKYEYYRIRINLMSRDIIFLLKACISVLKPFYKVTLILSGQKYTTISIVMHSCYYLRWKLSQQQDDPIANSLQEKLLISFEFYMEKYDPSERVFSAASNQIWARRNRLAAASVEKIMFLLNNLSDDINLLSLND